MLKAYLVRESSQDALKVNELSTSCAAALACETLDFTAMQDREDDGVLVRHTSAVHQVEEL